MVAIGCISEIYPGKVIYIIQIQIIMHSRSEEGGIVKDQIYIIILQGYSFLGLTNSARVAALPFAFGGSAFAGLALFFDFAFAAFAA